MNSNNTKSACVFESAQIHEETNARIYQRNIPSQTLQPYLDVRAVPTKYSHFPIVDPRPLINVGMVQRPTFSTEQVFNPGNTTSPWSGFSNAVNTESDLRNQIFALQKCDQSVYVPSSKSDLYEHRVGGEGTNIHNDQKHSLLFANYHFEPFNPNPQNIGTHLFMNNTRMEIRDIEQGKNCS